MAPYRLALLALAAMQLPAHAGAHGAEECTVPGACLDEAEVEAAEQGEADALRVELLQARSSVAARASTGSNTSSGASSDRTFWFVSRKQCGGVAGVPGNVLWAAQCQPAAWDRTKSVIYMCEGTTVSAQMWDNQVCAGVPVLNRTMVSGECSDTVQPDDGDGQEQYECLCGIYPVSVTPASSQAC
ncbi:unnamed protein product [Prorocentrum cordatum]|uniref:Uncharacterized protein n=1 Tax=Prorocentrum cordatum TaxID=2364126 RepID=A0ABN9X9R6_9DINO|nr:unnamed protein product [Polarella glacialis]